MRTFAATLLAATATAVAVDAQWENRDIEHAHAKIEQVTEYVPKTETRYRTDTVTKTRKVPKTVYDTV